MIKKHIPKMLLVFAVMCSGCANPAIMKINNNTRTITGAAESAKNLIEECKMSKNKSVCDEITKYLDQIIEVANETADTTKYVK